MVFTIFKISKRLIKPILLVMVFYSCNDFLATDLRDKNVTILAPTDNLSTTTATMNFYWEELDGALSYHIQIAKPSFSNMTTLVVDTNLTGNNFTIVLTPGNYEWRIRAENGSTETPYIQRSFTIDSTSDLTGQTLILYAPSNDFATNDTTITLNWYGLYNADQYRILIKLHASGFTGTQVLPDIVQTDTTLQVSSLDEGYYDWGVRAENGLTNTSYTVRGVYIDYTSPGMVSLGSPAHNALVSGPTINFSWTNAIDSGSPLFDSLYVYTDTSLNIIRKSISVFGTGYSDTLAIGTYYWRIKAYDKAGNQGGFSALRKFTVN